jgi:hypothetical protein
MLMWIPIGVFLEREKNITRVKEKWTWRQSSYFHKAQRSLSWQRKQMLLGQRKNEHEHKNHMEAICLAGIWLLKVFKVFLLQFLINNIYKSIQNTNNKQLMFLSMRRLLFLSTADVSWASDWKEKYPLGSFCKLNRKKSYCVLDRSLIW